MNLIQAIILGIVQGVTEFAPVSSSAHLVLIPWLFGWDQPGLLFDTMVHWGTLTAVLVYFWRDWVAIIRGFFKSLTTTGPWRAQPGGRLAAPESRLAWAIIIGTIPAVILALLFKDFFESLFSNPTAVAYCLLVTAAILTVGERLGRRQRGIETINLTDAGVIGLAQAAAIAPGISRSGATIAAGLGRGLERETAARYSFLLSTPVILGAGALQLLHVAETGFSGVNWAAILGGFLAAAISGYLCIRFLLSYLRRGTLYAFAAYCAVVGIGALILSAVR